MVELIKQREQHPHLPFIPIWNCLGRCWHLWRWLIHPVWPKRSGEESGAAFSLGLQLPAAPPWHHYSVTLSRDGALQSPNTPPSHPCLVSSKLLQSAQALIGPGQVSAVQFNDGAARCQIIPSVLVWLCGSRKEGGRVLCVCVCVVHPTANKHIF